GNARTYTVDDIPEDREIAIIDDSRISTFFVEQLMQEPKNMHLFHSATNAWSFILQKQVYVVITDLVSPAREGCPLLHNIKSSSETAHIRVLVSTAEPTLLDFANAQQYRFDGIIAKPIQESELVKAIIGE